MRCFFGSVYLSRKLLNYSPGALSIMLNKYYLVLLHVYMFGNKIAGSKVVEKLTLYFVHFFDNKDT